MLRALLLDGFSRIYALLVASFLLTTTSAFALDQSKQLFGSQFSPITFNKTVLSPVSFPVVDPYSGKTNINPKKGTIVFNYTPRVSPDGDWGSAAPAQKVFFRLSEPNSIYSNDATLKIGTYFNSSTNVNYLYFRYDSTDGCTRSWAVTPSCYHEVNTYNKEPNLIMVWDITKSHKIMVTWDFTGATRFMALRVDGNPAIEVQDSTINITSFNPSLFYVGSDNGAYPAQGTIDSLFIYSEATDTVFAYIYQTQNDGIWQTHETVLVFAVMEPFRFRRNGASIFSA